MENKKISNWTVENLKQLKTQDHRNLFNALPAPTLEEMHGEFTGTFLGSDKHPISNLIWHLFCNQNLTSGVWLGKSFKPISDTQTYGFNNLSKFGMRLRRWPMKGCIKQSKRDGKEIYALNYRYYFSAAGIVGMQDEIRKVTDGLYIGLGHWYLPLPFDFKIPMASVWFALSGPVANFDDTATLL